LGWSELRYPRKVIDESPRFFLTDDMNRPANCLRVLQKGADRPDHL